MLLCPWNFPGKNTRGDCHFFLQGMFPTQGSYLYLLHLRALADRFFTSAPPGKESVTAQSGLFLCNLMDYSHQVSCPWNSLGKNTGVDCHSLLQGIFPTQGSNPGLLLCGQTLYHLSDSDAKKWRK